MEDKTRGPWYWQVKFITGEYNKDGVEAFTLEEACKILSHPMQDVKRFNFQTGRDKTPMLEEVKEKIKAIKAERRVLRNKKRPSGWGLQPKRKK